MSDMEKSALVALKAEFGGDLGELNAEYGTAFEVWPQVLDALVATMLDEAEPIREKALGPTHYLVANRLRAEYVARNGWRLVGHNRVIIGDLNGLPEAE